MNMPAICLLLLGGVVAYRMVMTSSMAFFCNAVTVIVGCTTVLDTVGQERQTTTILRRYRHETLTHFSFKFSTKRPVYSTRTSSDHLSYNRVEPVARYTCYDMIGLEI